MQALVGLLIAAGSPGLAAGFEFDAERSHLPPDLHARVVEVMHHIYNFEFEEAAVKSEVVRADDPASPLGEFLLAETYYWQAINNRDRGELAERFADHIEATIARSEERLDRDAGDPLALFFLGSGHGRKAILHGLRGQKLESVNASLTARKHLKTLNRLHTDVEDAYLGLGLYNYYAAQLPWFARFLSKLLLGLGGDHERGVAEIERAAARGLFSRVEARLFQALIYLDTENRPQEALAILEEIRARYPDNLDLQGMLAYAYRTQHDYTNAIRLLEELESRARQSPVFGRESRNLVTYFLASTYKVAGLYDHALPLLDRLVGDFDPDAEWLVASSLLERGRIHDLEGRREAARADYRRVLELRDFRGSRGKAERYLDEPYALPPEERAHHLEARPASAERAEALPGAAGGTRDEGSVADGASGDRPAR